MKVNLSNIKYIKFSDKYKSKLFECISNILDEVDAHNKHLNLKLMWSGEMKDYPQKNPLFIWQSIKIQL